MHPFGRALRRRRRATVALAVALTLLAGTAAAARAWLLRDPEPYFAARRAPIAAVAEGPVHRTGDAVEQDIAITAANGLGVELRLRRRADIPGAARQRLFVLLGGATNGKESASLLPDTRDLLVASLSYPRYGNDRATGLAVIPEVPAFRRAIRDTPPAVMLALDYLLSRPDVDTSRVELCGASFGVPFAAVVGALDRRVTRVWLVQGGANPRALIEAGLQSEIPFAPARWLVASLANILASGPRFDPAHWVGRIAPRPVVMINTEADERIPRESAEAMHAAAREPKEIVWLPGLHIQPNRPDVMRGLVDAVFQKLRGTAGEGGAGDRGGEGGKTGTAGDATAGDATAGDATAGDATAGPGETQARARAGDRPTYIPRMPQRPLKPPAPLPALEELDPLIDPEVLAWYRLSAEERWRESSRLWDTYLALGGSLDPEPDSQSPFGDAAARGSVSVDGRPGLHRVRRGGV